MVVHQDDADSMDAADILLRAEYLQERPCDALFCQVEITLWSKSLFTQMPSVYIIEAFQIFCWIAEILFIREAELLEISLTMSI